MIIIYDTGGIYLLDPALLYVPQFNDFIRSCFEAEAADRLKGMYHETSTLQVEA